MAPSTFSLLLLRRHISAVRHHHLRRLSSSAAPSPSPSPSTPPKPTTASSSLSARLSFVFDKIDEIEKDRSDKDDALNRIRAWRESKKKPPPSPSPSPSPSPPPSPSILSTEDGDGKLELEGNVGEEAKVKERKAGEIEIELAHKWPEWVALMERLITGNYFDHQRVDEGRIIHGLSAASPNADADANHRVKKFRQGSDFTRDFSTVLRAMINFGKDRFDILRSIWREDLRVLVGYGCPSVRDKAAVQASKLLRKLTRLDEGDVCSSCSLRHKCERAYLVPDKEVEATMPDLMRVLMTYGFEYINGSVENKSLLKQKSVKAVVRKLLHEVVRLSAVPIDPNIPPPLIRRPTPKVKQPPPEPKKRVRGDDIEMKIGDWVCQKCSFMNFAKNPVCLKCDAKRPRRQLLPGEWECPECDFLNYRRNVSCFNCERNRPPDGNVDHQTQIRQPRPPLRVERTPDRDQVSNAWNFDFDDDESDGADVEAFEFADRHAMDEDLNMDNPPEQNFGGTREDSRAGRTPRLQEEEHSRRTGETKPSMGFDDFADEDDDDIDNYVLYSPNINKRKERVRFSDVENEGYSESERDDGPVRFNERGSSSYPKSSKPSPRKGDWADSDSDYDDGSDEDHPVHPKGKSSHAADSGIRGGTSHARFKQRRAEADNDHGLFRGAVDPNYRRKFINRKQRRGDFMDSDEDEFSDGGEVNGNRGRGGFRGRNTNDFGRPSRGSGHSERGNFDDEDQMTGRQSMQKFDRPGQRGGGNRGGHSRSVEKDEWSEQYGNRPLRQR